MTEPDNDLLLAAGRHRALATTHWSMVVAASHQRTPESRRALEELCRLYWYPIYAHIRRRGRNHQDAGDLTQQFFAELLEKDRLAVADPARGKFRSFLFASVNNFLANAARSARAAKRGGGRRLLSLDFDAGQHRFTTEPIEEMTPERAFERRWALALLERALARLRQDYSDRGKQELFERLKPYLGGGQPEAGQASVAEGLGISEGAVRVALHRLRQRCRQMLRDEIAQTVASVEEVDDELRELFRAVGG